MTAYENMKRKTETDAKTHGYYLNPEPIFLQDLLEGLVANEERYGYASCPCRLASGNFEWDRDIICPCDYRDADIEEFGQCFCALYINKEVAEGKHPMEPIPERRSQETIDRALGKTPEKPTSAKEKSKSKDTNRKLFYCKVCGYLTFREEPPHKCPICQASKDMFEQIVLDSKFKIQ